MEINLKYKMSLTISFMKKFIFCYFILRFKISPSRTSERVQTALKTLVTGQRSKLGRSKYLLRSIVFQGYSLFILRQFFI